MGLFNSLPYQQSKMIAGFINANLHNPQRIADFIRSQNIPLSAVLQATGYTHNQVQQYFMNSGIASPFGQPSVNLLPSAAATGPGINTTGFSTPDAGPTAPAAKPVINLLPTASVVDGVAQLNTTGFSTPDAGPPSPFTSTTITPQYPEGTVFDANGNAIGITDDNGNFLSGTFDSNLNFINAANAPVTQFDDSATPDVLTSNNVVNSSPVIVDGGTNANTSTTTGTQGTTTTTGTQGTGATVTGAGGNTAPGAGTAGAGGTAGTVGAQNEAPVPQRYVPGSANLFRGGGMFGNWNANDPRATGNINRSGGANINRTAYTPLQIRRGLFS